MEIDVLVSVHLLSFLFHFFHKLLGSSRPIETNKPYSYANSGPHILPTYHCFTSSCLSLLKKYNSIAIGIWRTNWPAFDDEHVELACTSHCPVGLQQLSIDFIAVFKYKSDDDGLIEVLEYSICLNEF